MTLEKKQSPDGGVQGEVRQDRFVGSSDLTRWDTRLGRFLAAVVGRISRALGPHAALILTLAIGAALAASLTAVFAQVYESVVEADGVAGLDHPVLAAAKTLRSPELDIVTTGYTDVGGTIGMPILAVTVMTILALRRRSWTPVILIVVAGAGSLLMTIAGKSLVGRTRPPLSDAVPPYEHSASFPSGHSLNAVVIAGIVAYLIILRLKSPRARLITALLAAAFAITIGLSRVYLGHHWLTDVLAAWALGAAWLAFVITAHRLYLTARTHHLAHRGHGPGAGGRDIEP
ncbi:phosphatase PAP2 family protein [Arthrobacter sp. B3I4]|uniref:phosphatase PAP2 family protein n=1 Tax=Arthrobacter sp. B3I4 TaxID=3042267 RepID=UPI0027841CD3|nr:phosphatase PAP2 family protein [Arthrobacter sp. B3I4]MDQ0756600.1 membrane-associated phospholipid phosphatase [Arthrobacter sp. B3I4]